MTETSPPARRTVYRDPDRSPADSGVEDAVARVASSRPWRSVLDDLAGRVADQDRAVLPTLVDTLDGCREVLGDSAVWTRSAACRLGWSGFGSTSIPATSLPSLDGPRHRRIRRVVNRALAEGPSAWPPDRIASFVRGRIADLADDAGHVDLVAGVVLPLALNHLACVLGTDVRVLVHSSEHLAFTFGYVDCDQASALSAAWQLAELADRLLGESDPTGATSVAIIAASELSRRERIEAVITLLTAGFDTVAGQLSIIVFALLTEPLLVGCAAGRAGAADVVRRLICAVPVAGLLFPRAKRVGVDPTAYSVAVLDLGSASTSAFSTSPNPTAGRYGLTFGHGEHHCPGRGIALRFLDAATSSIAIELERTPLELTSHRWSTGRATHYPSQLLVRSART